MVLIIAVLKVSYGINFDFKIIETAEGVWRFIAGSEHLKCSTSGWLLAKIQQAALALLD